MRSFGLVDINGNTSGASRVVVYGPDGKVKFSGGGGGGVTSVTAIAPITSTGGLTPVISTLINTSRLVGRTTAGSGVMEEITVGTGLTLALGSLINSAPDQVVAIAAGTGISVTGTYPNFTVTNTSPSSGGTVTSVQLTAGTGISLSGTNPITTSGNITVTNSAPDQTVAITAGSNISVTGTYPNFTVAYTGSAAPLVYQSTTDIVMAAGTSGLRLVTSLNIPANTFQDGDIIRVYYRYRSNQATSANTTSTSLWVNATNTLTGATQLAAASFDSTARRMVGLKRDLYVKSGNTTNAPTTSSNLYTDDTFVNVDTNTVSIDWTLSRWILFAISNLSTLDAYTFLGYQIMRIRP